MRFRTLSVRNRDGSADEIDNLQRQPVLEINTTEMTIMENNGCNNVKGITNRLHTNIISFGSLAGTGMTCEQMEVSTTINRYLSEAVFFFIDDLILKLNDKEGNELLRYEKVD